MQDLESFNENTLLSDQDDFILASPRVADARRDVDMGRSGGGAGGGNYNHTGGNYMGYLPRDSLDSMAQVSALRMTGGSDSMKGDMSKGYNYDDYRSKMDEQAEPRDHLMLLATQSLATMREMVIARHCTGKSLLDIYQHFDRKGKFYIDAKDLMQGLSDLRIETSEKVADLMISILAIDGYDKVSFGEFAVFITDPEHQELEQRVREQLAEQLERQGRDFQVYLFNSFWSENSSDEQNVSSQTIQSRDAGLVNSSAFRHALLKIGVQLTSSEMDRLVTRFCLHGQVSYLSVLILQFWFRFISLFCHISLIGSVLCRAISPNGAKL